MRRFDPYRLLGLDPDATSEQVRAAFREKVREKHPDTGAGGDDGHDVREVIEAYRVLSDPELRARHDSTHGVRRSGLRGHRVPVRHAGPSGRGRPDGTDTCSTCGGLGELRQEQVCPDCRGRAEITTLDGWRGKVVRCKRCSGTGTSISRRSCVVCSGTGRRRS